MGVMKVCVYSTVRRLYGGDEGMCLVTVRARRIPEVYR